MSQQIQWLLRDKYSGKESEAFLRDVKKLKGGEPLDYIIGFREFLSCHIDLSKKPLIPREETEYWVEKSLALLPTSKKPLKVLDIFAGSGCIGLAVVKNKKNANVVFADKDKKAIEQIRINVKKNNVKSTRVKVIQSDVFSNIKGKFDIIFANPPYIPTTRKNKVQPSVLKHEPRAALFGGADGLLYIKPFLAKAQNHLTDNGKIYFEFDSIQKKSIEKLLKKYQHTSFEFYKDQYQKWRWVLVNKK